VEVDLDAIRANVALIAETVAPAATWAVVKADAYGHGDIPVAEAALAGGAAGLCVALVEEGVRLREAGIDAPILLLSEPAMEAMDAVVEWRLVPTVYRRETVDRLADVVGAGPPHPVHLKVDTGMHRVGAAPADAFPLARYAAERSGVVLEGIWTHFPVSETDRDYTDQQVTSLVRFRDTLAAEGITVPVVHAANTAGALTLPRARFSLVRIGLGIYGLRPAPGVAPDLPLRPAMRVVSHVTYARRLPRGARPSYGRIRPLSRSATVATVPIGYADGVPRRLATTGGQVLIRGRRFPLAGMVTMDQIVVDVGDADVAVGDEVVLLGRQGDDEVTAEEWATRLETINYEVLCGFGPRLPRRHLGGERG